jgi:hypothetical protein
MSTNQVTTATNLQGPDLSNAASDARKYFNNFYTIDFNVSSGANDAMLGFFEQYTTSASTAKNLAAAVLYTAMASNMDPMQVLSDFQALPKGQLNNYLVAFLSINRAPTSVIGTKSSTKTSPYVTRSILL